MPDNPPAKPPSTGDQLTYAIGRAYIRILDQPWSKVIAAFLAGVLAGLWLA